MNDALKQLVVALRSGEYKQINGYLSRGGKHCCLGVACQIFQHNFGTLLIGKDTSCDTVITYDAHNSLLPKKVSDWLGHAFAAGDGEVRWDEKLKAIIIPEVWAKLDSANRTKVWLSTLNDFGVPFNQIAEVIEKCLYV